MLVSVILAFIVLIFPLFLNIKIVYSFKSKKVFYILQLFGFIKLNCGYIQILANNILIHVSDTKAIIIELIDIDGVKKSFKPFMDYHFIFFQSKTEIGLNNSLINSLSVAFMLNYIQNIVRWFLINKKQYLKINNVFNVYENHSKFNFYGEIIITFNLIMIIISVVKILMEKIIYEFRKSRQQNY